MKKLLVSMMIVLMMMILYMSTVYAAGTYAIRLRTNNANVKQGDTVTISFALTNITVESGVGGVAGKLEYDKAVFEKVESANITSGEGWGTVIYNDQNADEGYLVVERAQGDTIQTENVVFKVTFHVLDSAEVGNTQIGLSHISASNGEEDVEIGDVMGNLSIAAKDTNENENNNPDTNTSGDQNNNPNTNTSGDQNNNQNTNTNGSENNNQNSNTSGEQNNNANTNTSGDQNNNQNTNTNGSENNNQNSNTSGEQNNNPNANTSGNQNNNQNTNTNTNQNNSQNQNSNTDKSNEDIPYTGTEDYLLPAMLIVMIIGAFAYIQYKRMKNI